MTIGRFTKKALVVLSVFGLVCTTTAVAQDKKPTDAQIKKSIIKESIAEYPGNCPCPYNLARNGSRCGKRSAYSRPGGYAPVCYDSDVTQEMIQEWRERYSKQ